VNGATEDTSTTGETSTCEADGLTRRRLLRLGLLAAGAGAVAIPAGTLGIYDAARAADAQALRGGAQVGKVGPVVTSELRGSIPVGPVVTSDGGARTWHVSRPSRSSTSSIQDEMASKPVRPTWLSTWDHPVYRLDDFLARSKETHLPRNAIMLTIDDGPSEEWTPQYLRLLAKYHVQATFCVIGEQVREFPHLVRAAVSEGHHIANHTYHHPLTLPQLSVARIRSEMVDTTDAIVRASGFHPRQFRAPGGNWGAEVFAEASRQEMLPLGWDIDPRDWSLPGVAHIRSAMLAARPHDIVLCHDGGGNRAETFAALKTVIPALKARGWTFVTLPAPQAV
jgi:peptidoglycan/xylan/chitin deacetylase (PgdA/CDA1 family)